MTISLDRVLFFISPGGSERSMIDQLGLRAEPLNDYESLGLSGVQYGFDNAALQVVWCNDGPVAQPALAPLQLGQRLRWPEYDGSPFALIGHSTTPPAAFDVLPDDTLRISHAARDPTSAGTAPSQALAMITTVSYSPRGGAQISVGLNRITTVALTMPGEPNAALNALVQAGWLKIVRGDSHHLTISIDGAQRGQRVDLAPLLPIAFHV